MTFAEAIKVADKGLTVMIDYPYPTIRFRRLVRFMTVEELDALAERVEREQEKRRGGA